MNGVMSLNGSCKHEELRSNNFRQRIPVLLWCLSFGHILLRAHSGSLSPRARFGVSLLMEQINPMIVEGQIIGGVVHGIGNALFERMSYGDTAQPVSRSSQAARHRGDRPHRRGHGHSFSNASSARSRSPHCASPGVPQRT
jgi:hypothetical protein